MASAAGGDFANNSLKQLTTAALSAYIENITYKLFLITHAI